MFDHVRHLRLLGAAHAHQRELDGARRVFVNAQRRGHGCERRAPRLAEFECAVGVLGEEHAFDGDFLRAVQADQLGDPGVDQAQPIGERTAGGCDAALRDDGERAGRAIDDADSRCEASRDRDRGCAPERPVTSARPQVPPAFARRAGNARQDDLIGYRAISRLRPCAA